MSACGAPIEMDRLLESGHLPRVQRVSIELDPGEPYFLKGEPAQMAQHVNDLLDDAIHLPRLTHGMNVGPGRLSKTPSTRTRHPCRIRGLTALAGRDESGEQRAARRSSSRAAESKAF